MLTYLVLPIAIVGLASALSGSSWGAALVLVAAFFGRALDGHHVIPDSMVAETALLLIAFWGMTAYLAPFRTRQANHPHLPLIGSALGAGAGLLAFGGVAFAPLSVIGAMIFATVGLVADLPRIEARLVLLEPLRILSVMVAAYWLMFHLS